MKITRQAIVRLILGTGSFALLCLAGTLGFNQYCTPIELLILNTWECRSVQYTPVFAGVVAGLIVGWRGGIVSVATAALSIALGLLITWGELKGIWFGESLKYTIRFLISSLSQLP